MKATLILLALAAATPALGETPGARLDRCAAHATPRDMSAECTALRADFNAQVRICLDAPPQTPMPRRARYQLCAVQVDRHFRLTTP